MATHKISIRTGCYGPYAMHAYEHIKELGVKYLELDIPQNPELLKDLMEDEDLDFEVGSFIFPITTDDPDILSKFEKACELTQDFNFEYFFSSTKTQGDYEKKREEGYKVLHKLGEIAERYGKFISMETHPPYCINADEMLKTMQGVNHPNVRINFDTGNIYYYNRIQPGDGISEMERVIDYIGSLHIKQTNGGYHTWFFPNLGHPAGIVDFKRVFEIMDNHGFQGFYTLEMEGTKDRPLKSMSLEEVKEEVKKSIEYLRKIGVF